MRAPTISERISFRWIPDPPSEPTSTIVLTSPTGWFVDVRIEKATPSNPESLQWAFAGQAFHSTIPHPSIPNQEQSKGSWLHLVDSKHPAGFQDSGVFEDLPDGLALEKGEMMDDGIGRVRAYEEVWKDWDAIPTAFSVKEGKKGGEVVGFFIEMADYAQGILKNGEGELGVCRWMLIDGAWQVTFQWGSLTSHLPKPGADGADEVKGSEDISWSLIENGK